MLGDVEGARQVSSEGREVAGKIRGFRGNWESPVIGLTRREESDRKEQQQEHFDFQTGEDNSDNESEIALDVSPLFRLEWDGKKCANQSARSDRAWH
jgi:hypothetical protein